MFENESQSYYEVLDIRPDASQNEIRQAYFRAKAAYGKDSAALYSLFDDHETRMVLEKIEQAYLVLSNSEKRKEYDRVHGFIKSGDPFVPPAKTTSTKGNVFSFGAMTSGIDPAHDAANAVFGNESSRGTIDGDIPTMPANASVARDRNTSHEEYSTPRTLAAATASSPSSEYSSSSSNNSNFSTHNNRLGLVRRIDLVKPYDQDPAIEEAIKIETSFRGEFLRKIRLYKNITVDELSEFTKISKTYLNCIESEEFESLPAPAYLRGFIIQIAKALKLPYDKVAAGYMANYKTSIKN